MSYRTTHAKGNVEFERAVTFSDDETELVPANIPDPIEPDDETEWELVGTAVKPSGHFHFYLFWSWKRKGTPSETE